MTSGYRDMALAQESSLAVVCPPHPNFLLLKEVAGCSRCWQREVAMQLHSSQYSKKESTGPTLNSELTKKGDTL